jgi:hypothetical protein
MRTLITGSLAAAGALTLAAGAAAQGDNPRNGGEKLVATLTPPDGGEGAGLFEALVNPETERICYTITAGQIDKATVAQIHAAKGTDIGDPVLTLDTPDGDDDDSEDCQDIDAGLAQALLAHPENYYVNVRTASHPRGAIRGQLTG